jgi:hypothetical protein
MKPQTLTWFFLLAALSLLLGGCATPALWEEGRFARFHEPADPPNLLLFHSKHGSDILVEYDETREGSDSIWRRAYWLEPNVERLRDRRKPQFVRADGSHGLEPIHVFESPANLVPPVGTSSWAVISTNGRAFTIWSPDKKMEEYELPVYRDASGRVKQVLLTPATVTADLSIVGGVVAYWCLPALWPALNCVTH